MDPTNPSLVPPHLNRDVLLKPSRDFPVTSHLNSAFIHRLSIFRVTPSSLSVRLDYKKVNLETWNNPVMEHLGAQEVEFSSAQPTATFVSGELGWERNMFQYQLHIFGYLHSTCAS